jgi:hypothetical protein
VAIEQLQPGLAAGPPYMLVNETVSQPLVHTRVSNKPDELRHQLREHFPRSEVAQNEHHRHAGAKFPRHRLDIFDLDVLEDFIRRHLREFGAAKQVRTEPPEMLVHKLAQFARRLFIRKRNLKIARCQAPILPGKHPRANTEELPESEEKRQRQRGDNG